MESATINQTVKRRKIIYFSIDEKTSEICQFKTKIKTNEDKIVYTSWNVFYGIEYFDKLMESGMQESQTHEVNFQFLNIKQTKLYIILLVRTFDCDFIRSSFNSLNIEDLIPIYHQLEYHCIDFLLTYCENAIKIKDYSIELYEFNKTKNLMTIEHIVDEFSAKTIVNNIVKLQTIIELLPDKNDEAFFSELFKRNICALYAYSILRNFDETLFEKYMLLYKPNINMSFIKNLRMVTSSETFKDDNYRVRFIDYILSLLGGYISPF